MMPQLALGNTSANLLDTWSTIWLWQVVVVVELAQPTILVVQVEQAA
jgi:hypothetical protein